MSDYKIIFSLVQDWGEEKLPIPWDEGCPLSLEKMQVSRNTVTGKAFFQARLKNISNVEVLSYRATLTCEYDDGSEEKIAVGTLDADLPSLACKEITPVALSKGNIAKVRFSFDEVKTRESSWENAGQTSEIPFGPQLHLSEGAKEERKLRLQNSGCAVCPSVLERSPSSHGSWWRCACGEVNVGFSACRWCGLNPVIEETLRDGSFLEESSKKRKEKAEEKERLEKEEKERKKTKAKIFAREHKTPLIVAAVIAIAALALTVCMGAPSCSGEPEGVHVPTSQQVETKANTIQGDKVELKRDYDYKDAYFVLVDERKVGKVYLSEIGLYIDKDESDAKEVYARMGAAMMMACDPSLDLSAAKSLLSRAVSDVTTSSNGVEYSTKGSYSVTNWSGSYYILRIRV